MKDQNRRVASRQTPYFLSRRPQKVSKKGLRRRRAYVARLFGGFDRRRGAGNRLVPFCTADGPDPLRPVLRSGVDEASGEKFRSFCGIMGFSGFPNPAEVALQQPYHQRSHRADGYYEDESKTRLLSDAVKGLSGSGICDPHAQRSDVLSLVTFFGRAKKVTRLPAGTGEVEGLVLVVKDETRTGGSRPATTPSFLSRRPQKVSKKGLRRRRACVARLFGGFDRRRGAGNRLVPFCTADGPDPLRPVLRSGVDEASGEKFRSFCGIMGFSGFPNPAEVALQQPYHQRSHRADGYYEDESKTRLLSDAVKGLSGSGICGPHAQRSDVLSLVTFFGRAKKVTRLPAGTGDV